MQKFVRSLTVYVTIYFKRQLTFQRLYIESRRARSMYQLINKQDQLILGGVCKLKEAVCHIWILILKGLTSDGHIWSIYCFEIRWIDF